MAPPHPGHDRRKGARVATGGDVLGRIDATAAPVVNLSETGALVELDRVLRPGTVQHLHLPLGDVGDQVLRCRVVRSFIHGYDPGGDESRVRFRAALEFVGMSDEQRAALRAHLEGAPDERDDDREAGQEG
jgi:hypothetical protein